MSEVDKSTPWRDPTKQAAVCGYCRRYIAQEQIEPGDVIFVDWSVSTFCKECDKHGRHGVFS